MAKTLGYMITWTTYGSWLQGDKRGYVKKGKIYSSNENLTKSNQKRLTEKPVKLSREQQQMVRQAILDKAKELDQHIYALSVSSRHVHVVAEYISQPIGLIVNRYKNSAQAAIYPKRQARGRIWTKGFDKRYCFDQKTLKNKIKYVNSHKK